MATSMKTSTVLTAPQRHSTLLGQGVRPLKTRRITLKPVNFKEGDKESAKQRASEASDQAKGYAKDAGNKLDQFAEGAKQKAHEAINATVPTSSSGFLASTSSQGTAFGGLAIISAAAATVALVAPAKAVEVLFNSSSDAVVDALVRAFGATLLGNAIAKHALADAAQKPNSFTAQLRQLNVGLIATGIASLVVLAQSPALHSNLLLGVVGTAYALTLLVGARVHALSKGHVLPVPNLEQWAAGALALLTPRTLTAGAYSLVTLIFLGKAGALLAAQPTASNVLFGAPFGPVATFLTHLAGANFLFPVVIAAALKVGADNDKLGADLFRRLNASLAVNMLVQASVLGVALRSGVALVSQASYAMLGAQVGTFLLTFYQYFTPPSIES